MPDDLHPTVWNENCSKLRAIPEARFALTLQALKIQLIVWLHGDGIESLDLGARAAAVRTGYLPRSCKERLDFAELVVTVCSTPLAHSQYRARIQITGP